MGLAEGVAARITAKWYPSGVITPGADVSPVSSLGESGGQILRRVSSTLALNKDTYQSNEVRSDRQIADYRHGVRRVQGNIAGEWSPATYADFFEAAFRGTWASAIAKSDSELTSVSADANASTFTFGGGDPVSEGYRVGMVVQFTNLSESANNSKNFLILSFSGANNRTMEVYPAPTTMGADSAFNITTTGKSLIVPSSNHVSRKVGIEIWNEDVDIARVFTECRVGGFNLQLPPTGMSTVDFTLLGRNEWLFEDSNAPFFISPTDATTTGIFAAVNGLLRVGGETVAVVTGLNVSMNLNPTADPVVGSDLVPEIFLGRANVTGQMTAMFQNATLLNDFINESEIQLLAFLTTTSADDTPCSALYLPRVKLGGADLQTQGEGGQLITLPFQALKSTATTASTGIEQTTIQLFDSEI